MKTSENIEKIALALANFQKNVESPKKSSNNPAFKRDGKALKYADLDAIIKVITPALSENGLSQMQFTSSDIETKTVKVTTMLLHSSGQYMISDDLVLPAENFGKFNAQTIGSSITYGRRYSLSAMLGIASEDDDDANAQSQNYNKNQDKPQAKQQNKPQPPQQDSYQAREEELLIELENKMQSLLNKTGMKMIDLRNYVIKSVNDNKGTNYHQFQQVDKGLAIGILKTLELKYEQKQREKAEQQAEQGSMLEGMTNKPLEDITWGTK